MNHWIRTEKVFSKSLAPVFRYENNMQATEVWVRNEQSYVIHVKFSSPTSTDGSEWFYPIQPTDSAVWYRTGLGVIYVNGPNGTAVGAYLGNPSYTLLVDNIV